MRSVELFSGAGGLGIGLEKAGFFHDTVIEISNHACETIRKNKKRGFDLIKNWNVIEEDISTFQFKNISGDVELVSGGPPCQPFSLAGKHRGNEDDRDLFPQATRAIDKLSPRAFIFENVKGLLGVSFSEYFEYILLRLTYPRIMKKKNETWTEHLSRLEKCHTKGKYRGLKYNVVFRLLNAANYGVPQFRERLFIVGFRSDLHKEWSFPNPTHAKNPLLWEKWVTGEYWDGHEIPNSKRPSPSSKLKQVIRKVEMDYGLFPPREKRWLTVRDALKGLPPPAKGKAIAEIENHEFRKGAKIYPGHTGSHIDEPAKTLKAGDHGVPGGENMLRNQNGSVRYFTSRESARLQTFPDEYIFTGSWSECMRQIGNAVPVDLAEVVGRSVKEQLGD